MARPRTQLTAIGLAVGAAAVLATVLLGDGLTSACPAIGYADISPIELRVDPSVDLDSVAACFGPTCRPVPVAGSDDHMWAVPQTDEYLQGGDPGSIIEVTVVASSDGVTLVDDIFEIGQERAGAGGFPQRCPGPTRYLAVEIVPPTP